LYSVQLAFAVTQVASKAQLLQGITELFLNPPTFDAVTQGNSAWISWHDLSWIHKSQ